MCTACDIAVDLSAFRGSQPALLSLVSEAENGGRTAGGRCGARAVPSPRRKGRSTSRAAKSIRKASTAPSATSNGPCCVVTLGIYYLAAVRALGPRPDAPDQAVLVDLPNRRFYFFFIEMWPQEIYYFTGLLILAAMVLFLMNAVAGRVWCGYLCPQTVWTDLFLAIERWCEGDRRERMQRDSRPWTAERVCAQVAQAFPLADGRVVDRRRLGALLLRRADAGGGSGDLPGAVHRLSLDRHPHRHDLYASPASCASRSASTCARGRASRPR